MTATSTTLALGTMPLWLFVFSKAEQLNDDLVVPFQDLGNKQHEFVFDFEMSLSGKLSHSNEIY